MRHSIIHLSVCHHLGFKHCADQISRRKVLSESYGGDAHTFFDVRFRGQGDVCNKILHVCINCNRNCKLLLPQPETFSGI